MSVRRYLRLVHDLSALTFRAFYVKWVGVYCRSVFCRYLVVLDRIGEFWMAMIAVIVI